MAKPPAKSISLPKKLHRVLQVRKERVEKILPILKATYPQARCSLNFSNPLQLLVATILSAQCTDVRVNIVTRDLFHRLRTAKDFANVSQEDLEQQIQSTGFYRNKATNIRAMARDLVDKYDGQVPRTMDELTGLAGVGRKTANVVLGNAYGINVGITVDTHVTRVAGRLGLTKHSNAVKIEQDLMPIVPQDDWALWSHLLIHHGRSICVARKPRCSECPLKDLCPSARQFLNA
jgi:endonuclease-3